MTEAATEAPVEFETSPGSYHHWQFKVDGQVARLELSVKDNQGLRPGYSLKLNSYDLSVDIELADALQRLRFTYPHVRAVVVTSANPRIFSAGANIYMLAQSSHPSRSTSASSPTRPGWAWRTPPPTAGPSSSLLSTHRVRWRLRARPACDELLLVDDASSAVSLPEVALLAVLPGTGGLTEGGRQAEGAPRLGRCILLDARGMKGKRAQEWRLVDRAVPRSQFDEVVAERASALAASNPQPGGLSQWSSSHCSPKSRLVAAAIDSSPSKSASGSRPSPCTGQARMTPPASTPRAGTCGRFGNWTTRCFICGSIGRK